MKPLSTITVVLGMLFICSPAFAAELTPIEQLGKALFFDPNLSSPAGQSCATCHDPAAGWTSPEAELNIEFGVYHGALEKRFGNRKPPASAYADAPPLHQQDSGLWAGGTFWDGRASGAVLGDPLAEQAIGPFLNPVEQHNPGARQVILKVQKSRYARLFEQVWGKGALDAVKNVDATYEKIGRSIAAYERSAEVNPFSSKYDSFLKGEAELTAQEALGLELFNGKAQCAICHPSIGEDGEPPMFTHFAYANIGFPKNPNNPFYTQNRKINPDGADWVDYGLGATLKAAGLPQAVYEAQMGAHKVPSLRNQDLRPAPDFVKAYGHNGVFKSLEELVHFYNTRDVGNWPAPEVPQNVLGFGLVGDLGLTADEEAAVVAFLRTLSDGYVAD